MSSRGTVLGVVGAALVMGGLAYWQAARRNPLPRAEAAARSLTFTRDIAPIFFKHCADCHRPGQAAPFSLLQYADAKKHAQDIVEVTKQRIMPPWLPEPGFGDFENPRVLSEREIASIEQWVAQGAIEGAPSDLPPAPKWTEGWHLGPPDLVVEMAQAYELPAEGGDIYRNFVVPVPVQTGRFVKAFEFRPGNPKVVHHAFIRFDQTPTSRRLDEKDPAPGFSGIHAPLTALTPEGHFSSWQPGKIPAVRDITWTLNPGADLVLQLHMQPSGKPEAVRASVGFYFAAKPSPKILDKIHLTSFEIDIPAGATHYAVRDSYVLPVDVELLGVLPHAHYLGKRLEGTATLPNGATRPLLLIRDWNFNWQGDYRYARPILLPKGTRLAMEFTYDNSANNPRNPNTPPQRVRYGLQSTDEMAELWLQVAFRSEQEKLTFARDYQFKVARDVIAYNRFALANNPGDADAHLALGKALITLRKDSEAETHLRSAIRLKPDADEATYFLGLMYRRQGKLAEARRAFEETLRINPQNAKAHGNLGIVLLEQRDLNGAETSLKKALELNPNDSIAFDTLREIEQIRAALNRRP